ncbi:transporter, partial [Vibrio parahaemolyticus]|nr:transporter [Vibrio parahaemolyticus]
SSDHVEVEKISAFSYLTYRERVESQLTKETWYQLADYIHVQKRIYDAPSAVDSIQLETHEQDLSITDGVVIPKMKGKVVLAEPVWTIPSLIRHSEWLHSVIRATGLELEIIVI